MTNEEFYDKEIAPELLKLAHKCKDRELPFLAFVQYDMSNDEKVGSTLFYNTSRIGFKLQMLLWLFESNKNIDAFIFRCAQHARKFGHGSIFLTDWLKIPNTPPKEGDK